MTRDLERESLWRGRVFAQGSSGVSVRAYCAAQGLSESSFHYWKRELKRREGERAGAVGGAAGSRGCVEGAGASEGRGGRHASAPGVGGRAGRSPGRSMGLFAEVCVRGAARSAQGGVEVVLGAERRIRVGADFDEETLRRVVSALEAMGC